MTATFALCRNAFGHLALTTADGQQYAHVVAVRAFPLAAPDEGISLVSADGHEVVWIDTLDSLPAETAQWIREALAEREFMPTILRLTAVSTFASPSTWSVITDRGETQFILRGEEDIRRIGGSQLLVTDSHGIQYRVADLQALDATSRRLLDRFL